MRLRGRNGLFADVQCSHCEACVTCRYVCVKIGVISAGVIIKLGEGDRHGGSVDRLISLLDNLQRSRYMISVA